MTRFGTVVAMVFGDALVVGGAYVLAFLLRFGGFPHANWVAYLNVGPVMILATLAALALYRGYRDLHRPVMDVVVSTELAVAIGFAVGVATAYFDVPSRALPRSVLLIGAALSAVLLPAFKGVFVRSARASYFARPVTVVRSALAETTADETVGEANYLQPWSLHLPDFIRVENVVTVDDLLASSGPTNLAGLLILMPDLRAQERERVVRWATRHRVDLFLMPGLYDLLLTGSHPTQLGDVPVIAIHRPGVLVEYQVLKRLTDVVVATLLLLVFSPALLLIPCAIWLGDRGPVFFRQRRVGQEGRVFEVLKFRTMVPDGERETGAVWAMKDDPRVTPVGRILRALRLDELPQLFNVLRGEMSLVGPRPERPELVALFEARNPLFRLRTRVKPGLTGLAQVMGRYDTHPDDKLRFDLMYIAHYSPWLDFQILLWTVAVMISPQSWLDKPPALLRALSAAAWSGAARHDGTGLGPKPLGRTRARFPRSPSA
ncbi:MAG: sugar transferase [Chloroflexi bacterium]|nr:sugar transferase [Chloroflexota bacterium]